jgi:hypothetical protein
MMTRRVLHVRATERGPARLYLTSHLRRLAQPINRSSSSSITLHCVFAGNANYYYQLIHLTRLISQFFYSRGASPAQPTLRAVVDSEGKGLFVFG